MTEMDVEQIARAIDPEIWDRYDGYVVSGHESEHAAEIVALSREAAVRVQALLQEAGVLDAVEKVEAVERALHDAPYLLARERLSKITAILDGSGVPE